MEQRSSYIDILKAIGIISIVIGHSTSALPGTTIRIGEFVYTYHIMIFLFVTGFCFKRKYAESPFLYIGKRLQSLLPLYVKYSVFFILLHNLLLKCNILSMNTPVYDINSILINCVSSTMFLQTEAMLGAFWFIPMYFFAVALFSVIFSVAEKTKFPIAIHFLLCMLVGGLGVYANLSGWYLHWHIQTSLLAIPVIYLGFLLKCYWGKIKQFIPIWGGIVSALVIYWLISMNIGQIELSANMIMTPILFYPVTFLGIYFCLALAKGLEKINVVEKFFAYIGRNSFHIMALHFFAFKLVDVLYGTITQVDVGLIGVFPHAFNLGFIYYIVGIFLPLIFIECGKFVKTKIIK